MTRSIHDEVYFQGKTFWLCGLHGPTLLDPTEFGLKPSSISTASGRGWMAKYAVTDHIYLDNLSACHRDDSSLGDARPIGAIGPVINHISPIVARNSNHYNCEYENLHLPLQFTGGLLVGERVIWPLAMPRGYQPFWVFDGIFELLFDEGKLASAVDRSQVMREFRERQLVPHKLVGMYLRSIEEAQESADLLFTMTYKV